MQIPTLDVTWLDHNQYVTLTELSSVCAMSASELDELVDYGALIPLQGIQTERTFRADCVMPLRAAHKLQTDFDLDLFTVAMVLGYMGRIDALEQQVISLQALMPRYSTAD
jgi:chaperone modulatory protein CbpM